MPIHQHSGGQYAAHALWGGAQTECKVWQKTSGGQQLIYSPVEIIDDFEDLNVGTSPGRWTVPGSTGSDTIVSPGMGGTNRAWKLVGPREGHLSSSNAIDRGPQPGETFEFQFRPTKYDGSPSLIRFDFACPGISAPNFYRIEFEGSNTSGADMSIEKYSNGSPTGKVDTISQSPSVGDHIVIRVSWRDGNNGLIVNYFENGSYRATARIDDTEYSAAGVRVWCNAYVDMVLDEILIPS